LAEGQHDAAAAAEHFGRALAISSHLPADTRDSIAQSLIVAALRSGQYQKAVDAFDAWTTPPSDERRTLRRIIDGIRADLAAGRPVSLDPDDLPDPDE
jgi:hypothetical protein